MQKQQRKFNVSSVLRWLVPLLISAAAVFFLSRQVDLEAIGQAFTQVPLGTFLVIVLLFIIGLFLRAACCYVILEGKFTFKTTFFGMNAGYLLNNVLPFRLGEFGRAALLSGKGKEQIGFMEVFASIVTERTLDIFLGAIFFLITLSQVVERGALQTTAWILLVLTILLLVLLSLASRNKQKLIGRLDVKWAEKPKRKEKILPKLEGFLDGFGLLLKPKKFLLALSLLASSWACSVAMIFLLNRQLLSSSEWWWGAFITSSSAFASALPSAPASLGVYEAATVAAYSLLGVDQSLSLVIALILHAVQFVIPSLLGMLGIYLLGDNFSSLVRRASQQKIQKGEGK